MTDGERTGPPWARWIAESEASIRTLGRWRSIRTFDARGPHGTLQTGSGPRSVVSFASNDYLGLGTDDRVRDAAIDALRRWGAGAGASRLVVGSRPIHDELEAALARWRDTDAALLFPTGYAANIGVLTALSGPGVEILSDELNHASIVDGCRLARAAGARVTIIPHCDLDALEDALARSTADRVLVVSDVVFSMDGDVADVAALTELCERRGALLVLDEAHSVLQAPPPRSDATVIQVGTLSKTLGALGGFVAGSRSLIDLLINRARPFIFSTALSPADAAAASAAVDIVTSTEGDALRARLRDHVDRLAPGHPTPIIPWVLGDEDRALAMSAALLERGILVPAIRPPTVAPGASRLRIALSAAHTPEQVTMLREALDEFRPGRAG